MWSTLGNYTGPLGIPSVVVSIKGRHCWSFWSKVLPLEFLRRFYFFVVVFAKHLIFCEFVLTAKLKRVTAACVLSRLYVLDLWVMWNQVLIKIRNVTDFDRQTFTAPFLVYIALHHSLHLKQFRWSLPPGNFLKVYVYRHACLSGNWAFDNLNTKVCTTWNNICGSVRYFQHWVSLIPHTK